VILAVSGTRTITDRALVWGALDEFYEATPFRELIHGGCRGVDTLAQDWAWANQLPEREFPADWSRGPQAGPERNARMIAEADALVAVWDGKSTGTRGTITLAKRKGIRVVIARPKTPGG
jgi:hypothetical protein